jgi:hypothetical protein
MQLGAIDRVTLLTVTLCSFVDVSPIYCRFLLLILPTTYLHYNLLPD